MARNEPHLAHDQWSDLRRKRVTVIYFLGTQDGETIKIGRTDRKVSQRMDEHAGRGPSKSANKLIYLAAVPGINSDEANVHSYFRDNRLDDEREWFKSSDELRGYIRWLRMQWFTLRHLEEADNDEIARSHDGIDGSIWLPKPERIAEESKDNSDLFSENNPWSDVVDVEPEITGDDFYTDERIIKAAREVMGGIDLDPATHPIANRKFVRAPRIYTLSTNGLAQQWAGRVWVNPPFGKWKAWTPKIISEWDSGRIESMCVLAATRSLTAKSMGGLRQRATSFCITDGRIPFWGPKATSSPDDGHVIFYFGDNPRAFWQAFQSIGTVVRLDSHVGGADG